MDFLWAQLRSIRAVVLRRPANVSGSERREETLSQRHVPPALSSRAVSSPRAKNVLLNGRKTTAEDFVDALRIAVEGDAQRRVIEREIDDVEKRLYQVRLQMQASSVLLEATRPRMLQEAKRYMTQIQQRYDERIESQAVSNPESYCHKLEVAKKNLRAAETKILRSMSVVYENAQKWADETMPECKIGPLQANPSFFLNLITSREMTTRLRNGEQALTNANRRWTIAMQRHNEASRAARHKGPGCGDRTDLDSSAKSCQAAEEAFNECREDLKFLRIAQKEAQSLFLAKSATSALTDSGLIAPPEGPTSSRDDMSYVGDQDSRYITTETDHDIDPLLKAVGDNRKELARLKQLLQRRLDFYSEGLSNTIMIMSSGAKEAWDAEYKKNFKFDFEAFRTTVGKAIEKAKIKYRKARETALEAGILESELPLTPSSFAGEVDRETKQIVSRDSNASDLKARATWNDQRDRRRIRKWERKVARGRVEKFSPESPAKTPMTSPVRSIGSRGPPSPWKNPNGRWIKRENETRRRLREEAGKLREKKRREVARENLRNRGRRQEPVRRDPWSDEMEGVEFHSAGNDVVYDGPGEPDGGESWRKATESTNPLRLPLYPSAADRRRRRR